MEHESSLARPTSQFVSGKSSLVNRLPFPPLLPSHGRTEAESRISSQAHFNSWLRGSIRCLCLGIRTGFWVTLHLSIVHFRQTFAASRHMRSLPPKRALDIYQALLLL